MDLLRFKDAIQRLEDDPRGVPRTLLEGGFRGDREECDTCPVANYLAWATGNPKIAVEPSTISFYRWNYLDSVFWGHTPPFIERFIEKFDEGSYPHLDRSWDGDGDW